MKSVCFFAERPISSHRRRPGPMAKIDPGLRREDGVPVHFASWWCAHRALGNPGAKVYFTDEKLVGCRIWFSTRATIAPFFSVSARLVLHSGSAWKAAHFFSRSASDSHLRK